MKKLLTGFTILAILTMGCTRTVYVQNAPPRHDNGLHKGWYKHGKAKGIPPGQAKKMGRY